MPRRVVVTGIGILSPLAQGTAEHFDALVRGACGIGPITAFDVGEFPVRHAAEIKDFRGNKYLKNRKALKVMARDIQLCVAAASLAAKDAGIYDGVKDPARLGVSVGAGLVPTELDELASAVAVSLDEEKHFSLKKFGKEGIAGLPPLWLLKYLPNMLNSHIAIEYDAQGPDNCITVGNASSLLAIGEAARVIERGQADFMMAGGAESKVHPVSLVRLYLTGKLSTAADVVTRGPRPFCRDRSGLVAGEGAAVLILEGEDHAQERGARIYAEVGGFGSSCGGQLTQEISPDGRGAKQAIARALADAKADAHDIEAVYADASGLPEDAVEAEVIADVLGRGKLTIATRAALGHTMAGSGALDAATACLSIDKGVLPGTFGVECEPDLPIEVTNKSREGQFGALLVNAFTFGGQTASMVFKRYAAE
jgi:3-oxoacyl-[acyl-carrier-protein] synthase II